MAEDVNASIGIDIDASQAIAAIRQLSAEISAFHQLHSKRGAAVAKDLAAQTQNLTHLINRTGSYRASMTSVASATESFTNALEKNKLTMGETMRYAMGSVRPFSKMFKSEWEMVSKVARERVKDLQTQYVRLGRDANGAVQAIKIRPLTLDMDNLQTKTMLAAQRMQVLNKLVQHGSTQLLNWGKNTQWAGRQLMVGFTIPITMLGAASAKTFMDMEKQIIKIQRVYGDFSTTVEETKNMTDSLKELSLEFTKWGVSVDKTLGLAADAAATGAMGADLINQVTNATRLAVLGNVEQAQALETTMSVTNAFGIATEDLAKKIDFLNAVENQSVTSIEDLTTAIPIAAPVVKQLGGSVEDLAFFMTAMKEGGIDAGEGANALKSGLASIINPTEKASQMLAQYGINIKDIVASNKGDVKSIVIDFAEALDKLDPLNRAQMIEQLFGKFQFSRISTLFQNVIKEGTQAQRVLELSQSSTEQLAVLSQRELAKVEESTTYKFEAAMQRFQASLAPVGEEFLKAVTPLLDFGTQLLEQFNSWDQGAKTFAVVLTGVIGGIGPVLLMTIGLIANGVANLIKLFGFIGGSISGAANSTNVLGMQTGYMTQDMIEASAAAASLGQTHSNLTQVYTSEASALAKLAGALGQAAAAQRQMQATAPVIGRTPVAKKYSKGTMSVPGYASGVVSVPGPKGKGDVVPAMLSPGEAVIPAEMAKKYGPLIQGMVADNIPGYQDSNVDVSGARPRVGQDTGRQKSHLQLPLDIVNDVQALEAVSKRFKNIDLVPPEVLKRLMFTGSIVANLGSELNQALKGGGQVDPAKFELAWSSIKDKLLGTAVAGGLDVTDPQARQALKEIEVEVGKRATVLARAAGTGVTDAILASALQEVNREAISAGGEKAKVASQIESRRYVLGDIRSTYIKKELQAGLDDGSFVQTGQQIKEAKSGIVVGDNRRSYSGKDPGPKQKTQKIGGYQNQPDLSEIVDPENAMLSKKYYENANLVQAKEKANAEEKSSVTKTEKANAEKQSTVVRESLADRKRNTNPAFGMVAGGAAQQPQLSSGFQTFFSGIAKKAIPGSPVAPTRAREAASVDMFQQKVNMMATSIEQARIPIVMLKDAATVAKTSLITAAQATKDFSVKAALSAKDFAIKSADAAKKLAISAKEAAVSIGNSAKQMAINAGGAIASGARNFGGKAKSFVTSGRGAMIGSTASMGLMMASGIEGPMGDLAGAISGPVMALSVLGPLLGSMPPPVTAVIVALGALAAVGIGLKQVFDDAQRAAEKFAQATGASTKAIEGLAEASGTVSATQEMNARRQNSMNFARTEESNAVSKQYLASETGTALMSSLGTAMSTGGSSSAISNIVSQMSTGIVSGAVSRVDARAIIEDIGTQLGDTTFALKANAQIDKLLGPNGENLETDPIGTRIKIMQDQQNKAGSSANILNNRTASSFSGSGTVDALGMAGFRVGASTAVGAMVGSIAGPIGTAAGAVAGTIIGAVAAAPDLINYYSTLGTQSAAFSANMVIASQQSQQMLDSLQLEYEQRIATAKAAGDLAEAERLTNEYVEGRQELLTQNAEATKAATEAYGQMESAAQTGVIGSLDQQIKDLYSEGPLKAVAEQAIGQIGDLTANGSQTELTLKMAVASGQVDPGTMTSLLGILGEGKADVAANIVTNFGGANADQIFEFASMIRDQGDAQDFVMKIEGMTADEVGQMTNLLTQIGSLGGQAALDIALNDSSKLDKIANGYAKIQKMTANGPITMETVVNLDPSFSALQSQTEYFNSLPASQQKVFLERYLTVYETVTPGQAAKALKDAGIQPGQYEGSMMTYTDAQLNQGAGMAAASSAQTFMEAFNASTGAGADSGSGSGGGGGGGSAKTAEEQQLENLNSALAKQNKALQLIAMKEDEINKKYDKRKEALAEIARINAEIADEQRGQLDLADALSSGDIAAAARAAQAMRAKAAEKALADQEKSLEDARKAELATVTFDGLSREQLDSTIKDLERQIAELEYRMPKKEESGGGGGGGGGGFGGGADTSTDSTPTDTAQSTPIAPVGTTSIPGQITSAPVAPVGYSTQTGNNFASDAEFNAAKLAFQEASSQWTTQTYSAIEALKLGGNQFGVLGNDTDALKAKIISLKGTVTDDGIVSINGITTSLDAMSQELLLIGPNVQTAAEEAYKAVIDTGGTARAAEEAAIKAAEAAESTAIAAGRAGGAAQRAIASAQVSTGKMSLRAYEASFGVYKDGGLITGPGTGTSDSIPAMLSNGEYVVRAASVAKIGIPALEAINAGKIPELTGANVSANSISINSGRTSINRNTSSQDSGSVYNYSVVVNAETNANPDQIAGAVMAKIKQVEGQRVRGVIR